MKLTIRSFDLPLKHPFTISRETTTTQPTVIVELSEGGHSGFGEATTNAYYGVTTESLTANIESVRKELDAFSLVDVSPESLWAMLSIKLSCHPFALCAICLLYTSDAADE